MGAGTDLWRSIDWGKLLVPLFTEDKPTAERLHTLAPAHGDSQRRPGCIAAEACVETYGVLATLADGMGGFGVLGLEKNRLEEGAEAAEEFGSPEVAEAMRDLANRLPAVRTPEAAAELAEEMKPVRDHAWRLGRACGLTRR